MLAQAGQETDGRFVIGRENGGGPLLHRNEMRRSRKAAFHFEIAPQQPVLAQGYLGLLQRLAKARQPISCHHVVFRPEKVPDPAVPKIDQVAGRPFGGLHIVRQHRVKPGIGNVLAGHHQRHRIGCGRQGLQRRHLERTIEQQQSVCPIGQHIVLKPLRRGAGEKQVRHQHAIATIGGLALDGFEDRGEEGIADIGQRHQDGAGGPLAQRSCRLIESVTGYTDRVGDTRTGALADPVGVRQGAADGGS